MQDRFIAQGKLLAEANQELFDLQTERKAYQHKIDRLHDYETQIQQFLAVRKTWYLHDFWLCVMLISRP